MPIASGGMLTVALLSALLGVQSAAVMALYTPAKITAAGALIGDSPFVVLEAIRKVILR